MTEYEAKKYFLTFIPAALLIALLGMALAYVLDPLQIFHESYFVKNRYIKNFERFQNAGLINHMMEHENCCDTAIIGTSHAQNFLPSKVAKILGSKGVLQLSQSASLPLEKKILHQKASANGKIKKVIWDIHGAYAGDRIIALNDAAILATNPWKFFPSYLYDDKKWNDYFYLLSADVFLRFFGCLMNGQPYETYQSWYNEAREQFGRGKTLGLSNTNFILKNAPWSYTPYKFPNIDNILIPTIKNYPDQEFYIFIPPYSRHYYAVMPEERFKRMMAMRLHLANAIEELPNAKLYAFDETFRSVDNLDDYKDFDHFSEETSIRILEYMSQDKSRLYAAQAEQNIQNITQAVNSYIEHFRAAE